MFRRGSKCYFAGKRRLQERLFRIWNVRMEEEVWACGRYSETELGKVYVGNNRVRSLWLEHNVCVFYVECSSPLVYLMMQ